MSLFILKYEVFVNICPWVEFQLMSLDGDVRVLDVPVRADLQSDRAGASILCMATSSYTMFSSCELSSLQATNATAANRINKYFFIVCMILCLYNHIIKNSSEYCMSEC